MLFINGNIHPVEGEDYWGGFRVLDGKFAELGDLSPLADEEVIDLNGLHVWPGMVEAHCHLGMEDSAIGYEGNDVNEMGTDPITPQMRGIDGINPLDESVVNARNAGITTVASGPGSGNVVGGTFLAWKTAGTCIDDMLVEDPIAMKAAFGENPKRVYRDKGINTRMGVAARLRELLEQTIDYKNRKEAAQDNPLRMPAYNAKLEAMIPVVEGKLTLKCHAHQANDILTVIRIAKEYNLDVTLDHCTDGELIIKEIARSGYPVIAGPSFTHKTKHELAHKSFGTPKVLWENGVLFSITTDSPVVPQEYLALCAGLACKEGLPEEEAIKAITINPARILKLDERLGSIAPGKDADFIIKDGHLLDPYAEVKAVYIDGKPVTA